MDRWKIVLVNLKKREPHSLNRLDVDLLKARMYNESLQRKKLKWIGMKVNPPFFLPITIKENMDQEQ